MHDTAFAEDFWEASSLDELTRAEFGNRVLTFEAGERGVPPFTGATPLAPLRRVNDRFQRQLAARESGRRFSTAAMTAKQFERILAAVGRDESGRRLVPSAGGLEAVHTFGLASRVDGPAAGQLFRYDDTSHAIQPFGAVPQPTEVRRLFQLDCDGDPQLVLLFVAERSATMRKYGARGLRFLVQEAGHAAQNVGLRLAHDGLAGYVLGGALDREILALFGLHHVDAILIAAVACGLGPT